MSLESQDNNPPLIESLKYINHRPLWSVMIPTYNCASYLRQALSSVLAQDLGPDQMQIEVLDNFSTLDDPEAVVKELGRGRVSFFRQSKNIGAIGNFNSCIERSKGHLIHILHGDDWVAPNYYEVIGLAAMRCPEAALYSSRTFSVDADGVILSVSGRLKSHENQPSKELDEFWNENPLQYAGITLRRDFYERYGGYRSDLLFAGDWEMWVRAIKNGAGVILPDVLAFYRVHSSSETGQLVQSAENLKDLRRLADVFSKLYPSFPKKLFLERIANKSWDQAAKYKALNNICAWNASMDYWRRNATFKYKIRKLLGSLRLAAIKYLF